MTTAFRKAALSVFLMAGPTAATKVDLLGAQMVARWEPRWADPKAERLAAPRELRKAASTVSA